MKRLFGMLAICLPLEAGAADWRFEQPRELTARGAGAHFHHLDGAGRRHVAAGAEGVAVAWEQDGSIAARSIDAAGPGPVTLLATGGARQATPASDGAGRLATDGAGAVRAIWPVDRAASWRPGTTRARAGGTSPRQATC